MNIQKKRYVIGELIRIGSLSIILVSLYGLFLYYSDRESYWQLVWYLTIAAVVIAVIAIGLVIYLKHRRINRINAFVKSIRSEGLEDEIKNFILSFRHHKVKKGDWEFRGYSFDWERLSDLREILNEKGIGLSYKNWDDLSAVLSYYIQNREERITRESVKVAPNDFNKLSGGEFEDLLYRLFSAMGYVVEKTGKTGDQGGDLVANLDGQRVLIQAKRYFNNVQNKAVQEAVAARGYYNCNRAMVVTNSGFTREAVELAKVNRIELIEGSQLRGMLIQYLKESWD